MDLARRDHDAKERDTGERDTGERGQPVLESRVTGLWCLRLALLGAQIRPRPTSRAPPRTPVAAKIPVLPS